MYPNSNTLKTGNILLCRTLKGVEGKLLRLILNSYWNHAVIILKENKQTYVVEAKGGEAVRKVLYEEWCQSLEREVEVIEVTCNRRKILKYIGVEYDYQSLLLFLLPNFISKLFNNTPKSLYCFEFIGRVYGVDTEEYTPELLINLQYFI